MASSPTLAPLHDKIKSIQNKLHEIRAKKKEMDSEADKSRIKSPPRDYSKPPKAHFHHPHLEYVFGEIVHSPYMTKPLDPYSVTTLTMTNQLIDMKSRGIKLEDLPPEQRPYNVKQMRNQFIRNVINYRVQHDYKKLKENASKSRVSSPSASSKSRVSSPSASVSMKLNPSEVLSPVNIEPRQQSAPSKTQSHSSKIKPPSKVVLEPITKGETHEISKSHPDLRSKVSNSSQYEDKHNDKAKQSKLVSKSLPSLPPRAQPVEAAVKIKPPPTNPKPQGAKHAPSPASNVSSNKLAAGKALTSKVKPPISCADEPKPTSSVPSALASTAVFASTAVSVEQLPPEPQHFIISNSETVASSAYEEDYYREEDFEPTSSSPTPMKGDIGNPVPAPDLVVALQGSEKSSHLNSVVSPQNNDQNNQNNIDHCENYADTTRVGIVFDLQSIAAPNENEITLTGIDTAIENNVTTSIVPVSESGSSSNVNYSEEELIGVASANATSLPDDQDGNDDYYGDDDFESSSVAPSPVKTAINAGSVGLHKVVSVTAAVGMDSVLAANGNLIEMDGVPNAVSEAERKASADDVSHISGDDEYALDSFVESNAVLDTGGEVDKKSSVDAVSHNSGDDEYAFDSFVENNSNENEYEEDFQDS